MTDGNNDEWNSTWCMALIFIILCRLAEMDSAAEFDDKLYYETIGAAYFLMNSLLDILR